MNAFNEPKLCMLVGKKINALGPVLLCPSMNRLARFPMSTYWPHPGLITGFSSDDDGQARLQMHQEHALLSRFQVTNLNCFCYGHNAAWQCWKNQWNWPEEAVSNLHHHCYACYYKREMLSQCRKFQNVLMKIDVADKIHPRQYSRPFRSLNVGGRHTKVFSSPLFFFFSGCPGRRAEMLWKTQATPQPGVPIRSSHRPPTIFKRECCM